MLYQKSTVIILFLIYSNQVIADYSLTGSNYNVNIAKHDVRMAANQYCQNNIGINTLAYGTNDSIWYQEDDLNSYIPPGACKYNTTTKTSSCKMIFECLDPDTDDGKDRIHEIIDELELWDQ